MFKSTYRLCNIHKLKLHQLEIKELYSSFVGPGKELIQWKEHFQKSLFLSFLSPSLSLNLSVHSLSL